MAQKMIIDGDPGVDDALAILTALVDSSLDVLALTGTAGAVSGAQATRNLQFLVGMVDPVKHPRIGQSTGPSTVDQTGETSKTRHCLQSDDGLGGLCREQPDLHNRRESEKLIVDLVREHPHEVRVLTLGPLTNLAAAADLDPELPQLLEGIVCLGGSIQAEGDVTSVAEFNIWSDPESAATVLSWPTPTTIVPLESSGCSILTFDDVDQLVDLTEGAPNGPVMELMLQHAARLNRQALGCEGIPLHGVAALSVAARAEPYTLEAVHAEVELSGQLTRGMLVLDKRSVPGKQTNADLVNSIDPNGVVDYFSRSYRRAAG